MPTNILTFSAKKREFWQNTFPKILHGPKASHFPWDFDSFLKVIYTKFWYASQYFNAKITISFVKAKVKPKIWKYLCQNFTRTWYQQRSEMCVFYQKSLFTWILRPNLRIWDISAPKFAHFWNFETRFCSFSNVREISKRNSRTNGPLPKITHFWNFRDPKFALFIFLRNSETELVFSWVKISKFCRFAKSWENSQPRFTMEICVFS